MRSARHLFALALWIAPLAPAATADPVDYGPAAEVRVLSRSALGPDAKAALADVSRRQAYFGAMAYNADADIVAYFVGMASLDGAIQLAEHACARFSKGASGRCELYAIVVPRKLPKGALRAEALSRDLVPLFRSGFLKQHRNGTFSAFAMSGLGVAGSATDRDSAEAADAGATLNCLAEVARMVATFDRSLRQRAQGLGLMACEVVAVRGP